MKENITDIYFIDRPCFNRDFYNKYEFENLIKEGYNVKFLNLTRFLKGKKYEVEIPEDLLEHMISFNSKSEFKKFIWTKRNNCIIFSLVPFKPITAWLYLIIFKYSIKYCVFNLTVFPTIKHQSKNSKSPKFVRSIKRFGFFRTYKKLINEIAYCRAKINQQSADICVHSKQEDKWKNEVLLGDSTVNIYSYGADYKLAMENGNENIVSEKYAVFIDQYFCHHIDFKSHQIIHGFSAEEYYSVLNMYLNDISAQTGLKIVIAAHPRRCDKQLKDFDSKFDLYFNKTALLVKNSELVLLHFSTAISFAVIFNKPFLLLNSSLFINSSIDEKIKDFEYYFSKKSIFMENSSDRNIDEKQLLINKNAYIKYTNAFLKHPQVDEFKSFKDIVNDSLFALE